jgi:hypothetical protein
MSPDERQIVEFIDRAVARVRRLAIARLLAWTALGAATGAELGLLARRSIVETTIAAAIAGCFVFLRRPLAARRAVVARLERAEPAYRNLLVTADEITGRNDVRASIRARVFTDAAAVSGRVEIARVFRPGPEYKVALAACTAWAIVGLTVLGAAQAPIGPGKQQQQGSPTGVERSTSLIVTATIEPPPYTGLPSATIANPSELRAIEGSRLLLRIAARAEHLTVTHDGASHGVARDPTGVFVHQETLTKTGYLVIGSSDSVRRTIPVVVTPDGLPSVRITLPGRDLVLAGGNPRLTFDARAADDFGLRSLSLQYTKVSGSGEQFQFSDGEIPLAIARANPRDWRGSAARTIADLGLKDGDMLVYRAVASDVRPGSTNASSDAFFIEVSKLGVAAGDSFTLPQEETKYALSEQMLIVKTERLGQQRASMSPAEFREASINLGVEQRMIRAEFVFMLGGEVEDEEAEAEQSVELQEGRLRNRGQSDLRAATITMSQAEKFLTDANTVEGLKAERAAVTALQRAFSRDRYILRALAARSRLELSRRLTGDLSKAADWHRRLAERPENRRAAQLQDLLRGIAGLIGDAGADGSIAASRAAVLAEQALRTDASSTALRQAAGSLQRLGDEWTATDRTGRIRTLTEISAGVAVEATRALAGAPPPPRVAPTLSGAFADALLRTRSER